MIDTKICHAWQNLREHPGNAIKDAPVHLCALIVQRVAVDAFHDGIRTVSAVLHGIAVRDPDGVCIADIVMPELMEGEARQA